MRADRLLSLLLLLQSKHRLTAQFIAEELGISERTVYRDVDALCLAGFPIYTQPGTKGGIFLDENYRLSLTGLTKEQALSLFVQAQAGPLAELGMEQAIKDSLIKLFSMLPGSHQHEVERMRQRFLFESAGWFNQADVSAYLRQLQAAVWSDLQIAMLYRAIGYDSKRIIVDAYALVSKADRWYLVGRKPNGDYRTYKLSRIQSVELLHSHFERDPDFDLGTYWQQANTQFQQLNSEAPPYIATLQLHQKVMWYVDSILDRRTEQINRINDDGWTTVEVVFINQQEAVSHVMAMGSKVKIVAPDALQAAVISKVQAILDHHA